MEISTYYGTITFINTFTSLQPAAATLSNIKPVHTLVHCFVRSNLILLTNPHLQSIIVPPASLYSEHISYLCHTARQIQLI